MNVLWFSTKQAALVYMIAGSLLAACSYTVKPRSVLLTGEPEEPRFTNVSVSIMNAEKDNSEAGIRTVSGRASAFRANQRTWAQTLAESLGRELARRGANVRLAAPLTLSVAMNDIAFAETRETIEFTAKADLALSSGWSKEYKGAARMEASEVFSVSKEADRLAGRVVAEIVKAVISDNDFADQLKKK